MRHTQSVIHDLMHRKLTIPVLQYKVDIMEWLLSLSFHYTYISVINSQTASLSNDCMECNTCLCALCLTINKVQNSDRNCWHHKETCNVLVTLQTISQVHVIHTLSLVRSVCVCREILSIFLVINRLISTIQELLTGKYQYICYNRCSISKTFNIT